MWAVEENQIGRLQNNAEKKLQKPLCYQAVTFSAVLVCKINAEKKYEH
ncbi:MAG: hypothetical protein M0R76_10895 [Proteobacteria bacterium]|nr:hypothetical protein [Pseudomonadota bacterium]